MPSENDYHLRATVAKTSLGAQFQFFHVALQSLGSSGKKMKIIWSFVFRPCSLYFMVKGTELCVLF